MPREDNHKMSASPIARSLCSTNAHPIPSKKVLINDPNQMPDVYSSTPNGTLYSTTPGGKFILTLNLYIFYHLFQWNSLRLQDIDCTPISFISLVNLFWLTLIVKKIKMSEKWLTFSIVEIFSQFIKLTEKP